MPSSKKKPVIEKKPVVEKKLVVEEKDDSKKGPSEKEIYEAVPKFMKLHGDELFAHQRMVTERLAANPGKNLAIFFAAGLGKTSPATYHVAHNTYDRVVYMGPKAMHTVFRLNLSHFGVDTGVLDSRGEPLYATVTSSATNVYDQWIKAVKPILGDSKDFIITERDDNGEPVTRNIKVFVIMDEAHMFSSRVANILVKLHYSSDEQIRTDAKDKQAYKLYRILCRDSRIQVIALTGTPYQNHPFNAVPLFNILRREIPGADGRRSLAFPELFGRFYDSYLRGVSSAGSSPTGLLPRISMDREINADELKRIELKGEVFSMRIRNLILWFDSPLGLEGLPIPSIESNKIIMAPMREYQWNIYKQMEVIERRIELSLKGDKGGERSEGSPIVDTDSVYRSLTRQAGNFGFIEEMYEGKRMSGEEMLKSSPDEIFSMKRRKDGTTALGDHSCKMEPIVFDVIEKKDRIHGVYSYVVKGAGIAAFERVFRLLGWVSLNDAVKAGAKNYTEAKMYIGGKQCFMVMTGDESDKMKDTLMEIFSNLANVKNLTVRLVLYSRAVSLGLTFPGGREVHMFEMPWDVNEGEQALLRWIRIGASAGLPVGQRGVNIKWYVATIPEALVADAKSQFRREQEAAGKIIEEGVENFIPTETADEHVLKTSIKKSHRIDWFKIWGKAASINCHKQFASENAFNAALIRAGKVPPIRTFFRCTHCSVQYQTSFFIQEVSETMCTRIGSVPPPDKVLKSIMVPSSVISLSKGKSDKLKPSKYLLDTSTGLGWIERESDKMQVLNGKELQEAWKVYLKRH